MKLPFPMAEFQMKLLGVGTTSPNNLSRYSTHCTINMSFAGGRRGNKVKKGVQFTLAVVGASLMLCVIDLAAGDTLKWAVWN